MKAAKLGFLVLMLASSQLAAQKNNNKKPPIDDTSRQTSAVSVVANGMNDKIQALMSMVEKLKEENNTLQEMKTHYKTEVKSIFAKVNKEVNSLIKSVEKLSADELVKQLADLNAQLKDMGGKKGWW